AESARNVFLHRPCSCSSRYSGRVPSGKSLWVYRAPRLVGIEANDVFRFLAGFSAEVLLIDDAVLADHERLHAGIAIIGRDGKQSESADHVTFNEVIQFAERRCRSL